LPASTKDPKIERHTNSKCSWRERVSLLFSAPRHDIDLFICPSCTGSAGRWETN